MPGIESPLFVEAFTLSPATMSTSSRYLVSSLSAQLIPDSVNHPVAVGVPVAFTVQLDNRYGSAISRAGVAVTLGQVIYGQDALIPAESSINGEPEGTTPVTALTNAAGLATFNVVGVQAQDEPVMYEAWLGGSGSVPAWLLRHGVRPVRGGWGRCLTVPCLSCRSGWRFIAVDARGCAATINVVSESKGCAVDAQGSGRPLSRESAVGNRWAGATRTSQSRGCRCADRTRYSAGLLMTCGVVLQGVTPKGASCRRLGDSQSRERSLLAIASIDLSPNELGDP